AVGESTTPALQLRDLVRRAFERDGIGAVVLIDEYDKPILDNIETPVVAVAMREELKSLYSVLKECDPWLRFVFLTGVGKFAKAGIFSGLNNLMDITVNARYSAICGYTQTDLETVFSTHIDGIDLEAVRSWYNGYAWTGEAVYNPFDVLLFLDAHIFKAWWFETGTPAFLIKLLAEKPRTLPELDGIVAGEELLGSFDIENLRPETLLFQAGYLTIKEWSSDAERGMRYKLGFPNREVRQAFCSLLLHELAPEASDAPGRIDSLFDVMARGDTDALRGVIHSFFASIPNDWYRKNRLSGFEGYYASVVYAYFASVGYEVIPEDTTNKGRIDLTVKTRAGIWIFEFKVKGLDRSGAKSPLAQLREKGHAEKYRSDGRPLRQIGIVFDAESRNIEEWETG
ncbi:MAG: AAA family ATPase, partial [Spirochaetota bacterium]